MRMTKREKVLLAVLIFLLAFFSAFRFLVIDQQEVIASSEQELAHLKNEIERLESIESIIQNLDHQIAVTQEDQDVVRAQFFSLVEEQEEIILLLNEFLMNPDVNATALSFTPQGSEIIEETELMVMNINLSYQANYFSLLNFLRSIWQFDRKIIVHQLSMNATPEDQLNGFIQIDLYDLAHLTGELDRLFMWFQDAEAVKTNPFSEAAPGQAFQIRYVFIDSETAILAQQPYIPFVDIEGHWAEEAIHAMGERGMFPPSGTLNYGPDELITRGEFIILLDRLYDWPIPDQPLDLTAFDDYEAIGSYSSSVSRAIFSGYLRGYIVGYEDNTLRPNNPITYEEVEFVMRKILEDPGFNWEATALQMQEETGFESPGIEDFRENMTRAEAAYFLNYIRVIE